jgi:MFS transporter, DHA2 family, multidrug resistance protein
LLFIAQYLQLVLGLSPLQAGLWMLPASLGFILGSLPTPLLVRRARPAYMMAAGMGLAAVGFGLLTQLDGTGLAVLVAGSVAFSLGLAPMTTLATDLMVGTTPPERAGAASGISETSSEFGGALGIAILGVIGAAIYRGQVADTVPAAVPSQAAAAARDTLGGAVAAADQLPGQLDAALLDTAREAFTQGLRLSFAISVAAAVGIAILVAVLLRYLGQRPAHWTCGKHTTDGGDWLRAVRWWWWWWWWW